MFFVTFVSFVRTRLWLKFLLMDKEISHKGHKKHKAHKQDRLTDLQDFSPSSTERLLQRLFADLPVNHAQNV